MNNMQDRVENRRRRYLHRGDKNIPNTAEIEAEIQREDREAVVRGYADGRRSDITGY